LHFCIEDLPKPLLCVPLVVQWLWLAARYRSLTLPSAVNPAIPTGGLAGESKCDCLGQIGAAFGTHVAAWRRVAPGEDVLACRRLAGLAYPLIAKPDIGWCGYGVRRIRSDSELLAYQAAFPAGASFMVQRLVVAPNEAGLFYVRMPSDSSGRLVAVTVRHAPCVTGDGRLRLGALVARDPRLRRHRSSYAQSLGAAALERVPRAGEVVTLTTIASLRIGARYEDASACITETLSRRIDAIARSMPEFHVGRFDVRFESMSALRDGVFEIIEVNGAGSEAIHFWDPALPLGDAFAGVFAKQRMLFEIGNEMCRKGHRPVGMVALARAWLAQQRLISRYPAWN